MTEMKVPQILTPIKLIRIGNNHFPQLKKNNTESRAQKNNKIHSLFLDTAM